MALDPDKLPNIPLYQYFFDGRLQKELLKAAINEDGSSGGDIPDIDNPELQAALQQLNDKINSNSTTIDTIESLSNTNKDNITSLTNEMNNLETTVSNIQSITNDDLDELFNIVYA